METSVDTNKEILLNRIYYDIKQVSTNEYYSRLFMDKQVRRSKMCNCIIASLSVGGAALTLLNEYIPMITGIIVGITSIVKQISPAFLMDAKDIADLNNISLSLGTYRFKLQNIYDDLYSSSINVECARNLYGKVTNEYADKNTNLSKLFGRVDHKLNEKASKSSDDYLNEIYNSKVE